MAAPNCSSTRMPALSSGTPPPDGRLEAVVDDLLGGGDLRGLIDAERALPTEQLLRERAAVVEGHDVQRLVVTDRHDVVSCSSPVAPDQRVRRAVVIQRRLRAAAELRDDSLRQHFSQFHAPLVERVEVPDHALREHDVLVERDQLPERCGRESRQQNRVGRPVPLERPMRDQPVG